MMISGGQKMSNERDTQFLHFAELLFQELNKNDLLDLSGPIPDPFGEMPFPKTYLAKQIIARCAYDLVDHALDVAYRLLPQPTTVEDIPDVEE
jgi:hypothetical protein